MKVTTHSAKETKEFAKSLAQKYLGQGILVTLSGDLGTGKTTFTQGFALGLGITHKILSPTFVIIRQHQVPSTKQSFYHCDLYRFDTGFDTINTGISELLSNSKDIILIEWAERLGEKFPQKALRIEIKRISDNERELILAISD